MSLSLGIDLGTTSVKIVLLNLETGTILSEASQATRATVPVLEASKNEQTVSTIFETVETLLGQFSSSDLACVKFIGLSGQMHGVLLWKQGRAWEWHEEGSLVVNETDVTNLVTWQDCRCTPEFLSSLPKPDSHLGIHSGFGIPTMFWLLKNNPRLLEDFSFAGTIHDFLAAALTNNLGKPGMSPQNAASWGYFNTSTGSWNLNKLQGAGFPVNVLPEIKEAGNALGTLHADWCGIPKGCQIGVALGDLQASVYSTLFSKPEGSAIINISTSLQIAFIMPEYFDPLENSNDVPKGVDFFPYFSGRHLAVAAALTGGNCLATFVKLLQSMVQALGLEIAEDTVWEKVLEAGSRTDSTDLSVQPTLQGERSDPNKRGSILNIHHGNLNLSHLTRAICRGIIENAAELMPQEFLLKHGIRTIYGTGSALTKNPIFQQELRNVFDQIDIVIAGGGDSALGAAALGRYIKLISTGAVEALKVMANNQLASDFFRILNGLAKVAKAHTTIQCATGKTIVDNSSLLKAVRSLPKAVEQSVPQSSQDVANLVERASMVGHGLKQFSVVASKHLLRKPGAGDEGATGRAAPENSSPDDVVFIREEDLEGLYIKSLGVEVLQQNEDGKRFQKGEEIVIFDEDMLRAEASDLKAKNNYATTTETSATELREEAKTSLDTLKEQLTPGPSPLSATPLSASPTQKGRYEVAAGVKPISKKKPTSQLAATSKERKVPASRIGRLVSYGGLAAGLGFGAVTELTKRSLGLNQKDGTSSAFLTEANATRIVDTMCRVRGAALKIGQILSIQDNTFINPELQKIFERVRHAADFMPIAQMEKMMSSELGNDWRTKLQDFDEKPFAAASIGQVHLGVLPDKRPVAIKIQYPGVAQGIESDIDNLISVLNVWDILPKGMFVDSLIVVAKRELRWECDYIREAESAKKFRQLLQPYPDYYVPEVIDELSTKQVYTTELIDGMPVDQCGTLDQETRDRISHLLLDLFFRELFEFRFMQTDPNWSNFLYCVDTKQVGLLDFGASRDYTKEFADQYIMILRGAAENDRQMVLDYSRRIGFLTGYESKAMESAHVDTVMLLGEAFRVGEESYDFGNQNLTSRIQELVPVMVSERLCPPPEEVYSLHRKLSGMFLLCAKLRGRIKCRPIFDRVWNEHVKNLS